MRANKDYIGYKVKIKSGISVVAKWAGIEGTITGISNTFMYYTVSIDGIEEYFKPEELMLRRTK